MEEGYFVVILTVYLLGSSNIAFYLKVKGGKGFASYIGMTLALPFHGGLLYNERIKEEGGAVL